jgi:hypothetical protein
MDLSQHPTHNVSSLTGLEGQVNKDGDWDYDLHPEGATKENPLGIFSKYAKDEDSNGYLNKKFHIQKNK